MYKGLFQKMHKFQTGKMEKFNISSFKILSAKLIGYTFVHLVPNFPTLMTTVNVSKKYINKLKV